MMTTTQAAFTEKNTLESNFISAVVYVHNEKNRIEPFLTALIGTLETHFLHSEIICVNDFSNDGSSDVIRNLAAATASTALTIINMSYYHGRELAMNAGIDLTIGDFVCEFDDTCLDFDPQIIMDVYSQALEGYDIVSASPGIHERISSRIFYHLFEKFSDGSLKMHTERFRILSRRAINRIQSMNRTVPYRKAVYAQCGLKTDTIVYPVTASSDAGSPGDGKFRMNLAVDSLILFTRVGYDFSIFMTAFMMLLSIFMILYTVVIYATSQPVAGWTTTILFLSVAFFGLFGILTVIIKYLQLLIDLVFKKQHYSFESIEKLTS